MSGLDSLFGVAKFLMSSNNEKLNTINKGISEYVENKFRFICLNDNVATLMAIANDIGYEEVFRFQIRNKITDKDLFIGISGSGNSKNVIIEINNTPENKDKYYIYLRDINLYGKIGFSKISYTQDITIFTKNLIIRCDNNRDYSEREKRFKPVFLDI